MYKIIACDLDETLLNRERKVSLKDREAIARAREKGVRFVLATGRGYSTVQGTLDEVGLKDMAGEYVISFNGAALTENLNNRLLYFNGISFDKAKSIFEAGLNYDVCIHVYTENTVWVWNTPQDEYDYVRGRMVLTPLSEPDIGFLKDEKLSKVLFMNTDFDYLKKIQDEMSGILDDVAVSFSSGRYIEFNVQGADKGTGLIELARILGVDIKDTIAIGDNYNDLPMIQAAGLGIGVANTIESMKPLCDYITEATNNENAICEVIEKFVL